MSAHPSAQVGIVVLDTWRVIDRWWTEQPIVIWWREIERDGKKVVQRHRRGERWTDVERA